MESRFCLKYIRGNIRIPRRNISKTDHYSCFFWNLLISFLGFFCRHVWILVAYYSVWISVDIDFFEMTKSCKSALTVILLADTNAGCGEFVLFLRFTSFICILYVKKHTHTHTCSTFTRKRMEFIRGGGGGCGWGVRWFLLPGLVLTWVSSRAGIWDRSIMKRGRGLVYLE